MAAVFDFTGAALPAGATLTRAAGPWSRTKANGLVELGTAANVPRFEHSRTTGARLGLLVEPQRTNDLRYSRQPDSAIAWNVQAGASVTVQDNVARVDGTAGARLFAVNASGVHQNRTELQPGNPSFHIKKISAEGLLRLSDPIDDSGVWTVNLALVGSGWERVHRGHPAVTVVSEFRRRAIFLKCDGGTIQFYADLFQSEEPGPSTSAIETVGDASASRQPEVLTLDWTGKGVPDGNVAAVFTYGDLTQQLVGLAIAGGKSTVSTASLNQFCVRSIAIPTVSVPSVRTATLRDTAPRSVSL